MIRSRVVVPCLLIVALTMAVPGATRAEEPAPPAGKAVIVGRVLSVDDKPVRGAKVLVYHLSSAQTFSAESGDGGRFEIPGLPYGYFDVAVQGPDGLFVADRVLNVPPAGKASLTVTLVPGGTGTGEPRGFVGLDETAVGIAEVGTSKTTGQFLRSKTGIAILAGVGAVALLALALSGSDDEVPASPINP